MADYKVTDTELTSIANAIRTKGGTQAQLEFPTGFVSAVQAIPTGGSPVLKDETFTENGQYTAGAGYDGFGIVTVNVSGGGLSWLVGSYIDILFELTGVNNQNEDSVVTGEVQS